MGTQPTTVKADFRIDKTVYEFVTKKAEEENLSRSIMIRRLLIAGLKHSYGVEVVNQKIVTPESHSPGQN